MIHMEYINISCITQKDFNAAVGLIQYIHKEIINDREHDLTTVMASLLTGILCQ